MSTRKENTVNAGIVGAGFMGWVHAEALRRAGVNIAGICGSTPAKSQAAAERLNIRKAYASYDELLADEEVHSVHICTPNRLHFEMAKQALEAGKHVLCEKPLAMNSSETAGLMHTAQQHPHLVAGVNFNMRFYPLCIEARERLKQPAAGDISHITGSYVQDWLTHATAYNWRVLAEENGPLRAVADIGVHWLDLVHSITGFEVAAVCADLHTVHPVRQRPAGEVQTFSAGASGGEAGETGEDTHAETQDVAVTTEDYGAILLRYANGVRGCLHVSQVTPGRKNCLRLEVATSKQSLAWNSESPNELWIGQCDQANLQLLRDPALLSSQAANATNYPGGHNEGYADTFKQCFHAFYGYIGSDRESPPPIATFADGHRQVLLCEAILESHRQQRWTPVGDTSK